MRVKLQIPAHSSRDQRKRIISPGRGEVGPSPEPLNLNSEQAHVRRMAGPDFRPCSLHLGLTWRGPMAGGGPWQGGAGKPQEPRTVLLHSPTPPPARLHDGDRRAWDGLWEGGGERLAGEARGQRKNPRRALAATAPPPQRQGQCPCFVPPLFCSRPRQGKEDRRLEPQGVGRSDQATARGP